MTSLIAPIITVWRSDLALTRYRLEPRCNFIFKVESSFNNFRYICLTYMIIDRTVNFRQCLHRHRSLLWILSPTSLLIRNAKISLTIGLMHALKTYTATEPLTVFDPVLRQIQRQSLKLHLFAQIVLISISRIPSCILWIVIHYFPLLFNARRPSLKPANYVGP